MKWAAASHAVRFGVERATILAKESVSECSTQFTLMGVFIPKRHTSDEYDVGHGFSRDIEKRIDVWETHGVELLLVEHVQDVAGGVPHAHGAVEGTGGEPTRVWRPFHRIHLGEKGG
jgi:hypothetical protein